MAKKDGTVPHISLFKLKHMRGWWPFTVNTDLEEIELAVSIVYYMAKTDINNNIKSRNKNNYNYYITTTAATQPQQ
jgi:hypothetical protein